MIYFLLLIPLLGLVAMLIYFCVFQPLYAGFLCIGYLITKDESDEPLLEILGYQEKPIQEEITP